MQRKMSAKKKFVLVLAFLFLLPDPSAHAIRYGIFKRIYEKIFGRRPAKICVIGEPFPEIKKQRKFFQRILDRASGVPSYQTFRAQFPEDPTNVLVSASIEIAGKGRAMDLKSKKDTHVAFPVTENVFQYFYENIVQKNPDSERDQAYKKVYQDLKSPSARLHLLLEWTQPPKDYKHLAERTQLTDELFGKKAEFTRTITDNATLTKTYRLTQTQINDFWNEILEADPAQRLYSRAELKDRFAQAKKTDEKVEILSDWLRIWKPPSTPNISHWALSTTEQTPETATGKTAGQTTSTTAEPKDSTQSALVSGTAAKPPKDSAVVPGAGEDLPEETYDSRRIFIKSYVNETFNQARRRDDPDPTPLPTIQLSTEQLNDFYDQVLAATDTLGDANLYRSMFLNAESIREEKRVIMSWRAAHPQ